MTQIVYLELQPLPEVPNNETEEAKEKRNKWFLQQIADFKTWSGVEKPYLAYFPGFETTRFLFLTSYRDPTSSLTGGEKAISLADQIFEEFVHEIEFGCIAGDQGCTLDGQSFAKKARWKKKLTEDGCLEDVINPTTWKSWAIPLLVFTLVFVLIALFAWFIH
jgi:hypothetical protein